MRFYYFMFFLVYLLIKTKTDHIVCSVIDTQYNVMMTSEFEDFVYAQKSPELYSRPANKLLIVMLARLVVYSS